MEALKQTEPTAPKTSLEGELGKLLDRDCTLYCLSKICTFANKIGGGQWWMSEGSVVVEFAGGENKVRLVFSESGYKIRDDEGKPIVVQSKLKAPSEELPHDIMLLESEGGAKIYLGISQDESQPSGNRIVVKRDTLP